MITSYNNILKQVSVEIACHSFAIKCCGCLAFKNKQLCKNFSFNFYYITFRTKRMVNICSIFRKTIVE